MSNINNPETENVKEPVEKISTKLKFVKSDKTDAYVGFVSQNPQDKTLLWCSPGFALSKEGVRSGQEADM